jgi:uncharacterized membrane protein (DUF485 family)
MGGKVCIVCEKSVVGLKAVKIKDDPILNLIRDVKRATHTAQENELYVCEADLKSYQQKRNDFQKSLILFSILASVIFVVAVAGALLSGNVNPVSLFVAFLIALTIVLFSLIIKYIPASEGDVPVLVMAVQEKSAAEETVSAQAGLTEKARPSTKQKKTPERKETGRQKRKIKGA